MKRTVTTLAVLFVPLLLDVSAAAPDDVERATGDEQRDALSSYVLGPDDEIVIRALELSAISDKPILIESGGYISLPLLGRLQAAGLTVAELESDLENLAKEYVKNPQVAVSITEFRSQPVSILGAVASPGSHQLRGRMSLYEVISLAGGLRPDAGHRIKITRRIEYGRIPLPDGIEDPSGQYSIAEVSIADINTATNPTANIPIMPNDVISVPRADLVYVIGEVGRPGGLVLAERRSVAILEALSMAGGLANTAKPKSARILRSTGKMGEREDIAVDLKAILQGKRPDLHLEADDILFVPSSTTKKLGTAALSTLATTGTHAVIWGSVFR